MSERVLILGAGIAGLCAAMALAREGREVIVLDRDPAPPDLSPDAAFRDWSRRGVTQLRHSHVFLGRLGALLRERTPALWQALLDAGARESTFGEGLPPALRDSYVTAPGDEDLSFLFSRRSTLELIMRRYAGGLPGVTFVTEVFVDGALIEENAVVGVRGKVGEESREWRAEAVVDAMGRTSPFIDWLAAAGIEIPEEASPAGILYFTRHYRLHDGAEEPARSLTPGAGDLGYLKYGVFIADNRHHSVTLACPEIESEMRVALPRPDVFDAVCAQLPGVAPWTDPARAAPASKVFAMGALKNAWREFVVDGAPRAAGYFPIGDAALRTNPLYGRGCSTGAIQAFMLGDIFNEIADPAPRMVELDARVRRDIRPFFDAMVKQDMQAMRRAERERQPDGKKPRWRARLARSFLEDGIGPASRGDLVVLRALMRPFHMHERPDAWLKRPEVIARVLKAWATARPLKAHLYPPKLGPERAEMLATLGLA
jgi:2-polyprenyl-6-methoxyphenol hydroxylase-like FAD-dependent oxidoreductase